MWPRRRQLSDHWTSVIFSPGLVGIAEVQRPAEARPAVSGWHSYAIEGAAELVALKRLRSRLNGRCTTLLRHNQYQMLQVEAPQVAAEERREALRWRVKEMVDFPVDNAGIDVLDIPFKQGGRAAQVFVVVANHAALVPRIHLFQDAKVPLAAIDIPELAQRNVAALFEEENRGLALLVFDAEGGRLTFTYQGDLYAARHIDATSKDIAAPGGDVPGAIFERVLLDVQRSLDNFDRNFSYITLARLLVAPIPGAAAFVDYLKSNLYQPVALLDLAAGLDLTAVPALADPAQQAHALLAIGAALRDEAAA